MGARNVLHVKFNTDSLMRRFSRMVDNMTAVDVDAAVHDALDEVADFLLSEMQAGVMRHYQTGAAYEAVKRTEVQRAGNRQWVEVGALHIRSEDKEGFHIVYLEYGSPGYTTKNGKQAGYLAADPWLRPTMEKKAEITKIIMDVFKKRGVPNAKAA